jgi:hypothetical protein
VSFAKVQKQIALKIMAKPSKKYQMSTVKNGPSYKPNQAAMHETAYVTSTSTVFCSNFAATQAQ